MYIRAKQDIEQSMYYLYRNPFVCLCMCSCGEEGEIKRETQTLFEVLLLSIYFLLCEVDFYLIFLCF